MNVIDFWLSNAVYPRKTKTFVIHPNPTSFSIKNYGEHCCEMKIKLTECQWKEDFGNVRRIPGKKKLE